MKYRLPLRLLLETIDNFHRQRQKYRRRLSDLYLEVVFALEPLSASKEGSIVLMENEFEKIKKAVYMLMK